jgi:hypothetical protein
MLHYLLSRKEKLNKSVEFIRQLCCYVTSYKNIYKNYLNKNPLILFGFEFS